VLITKKIQGKKIEVAAGENTLYQKALLANEGDTLVLSSGDYLLSKTVEIHKTIVISGNGSGGQRPLIQYTGEQSGFSFFSIENGGTLSLQNLRCNGLSENGVAESFIRTSNKAMIEQYNLFVDACDFLNITDGRKHALKINKGSFADTIQFTNCLFHNMSGEVISIAAEKEDKGIYNAEHVVFRNCVFNKILAGAIDVYRGGNDESTTGFYFTMDHCTFNEVGNVELCSIVRLIGVQYSTITNCIFNNSGRSGRTVKYEDFGWTKNSISYCNSYIAGKVESFYYNIIGQNMLKVDPQFENIETGDFRLKANSPLKKKANDGKDMGAVYVNGQLKR
jgi:poly(beta-D-mannuronate) lyase